MPSPERLVLGVTALFAVYAIVLLPNVGAARTYRSSEILSPSEFDVLGEQFVRAVESRDEQKILGFIWDTYFDKPWDSLEDGDRDYLYDGNFLRMYSHNRRRPLIDIIHMGRLHYRAFVTSTGSVLLYFIPERYLAESKKGGFFKNNFLRKYFVCEFFKVRDTWKMQNVCFAGTDVLNPSDE